MKSAKAAQRPARSPDRQQFSAARLAAEAFFAPPADAQAPVSPPSAAPAPPAVPPVGTSVSTSVARESRVHRVPPAAPPAGAGADAVAETAAAADSPADVAAAAARSRLPRRKTRQLHGEVTVIRPVEVPAEPPPADSRWPAPEAEDHAGDWPRYPGVRARLVALHAEAEAARRHEVDEALRRIDEVMQASGITLDELF